jgi:Protein of unknown function (DUF2442)
MDCTVIHILFTRVKISGVAPIRSIRRAFARLATSHIGSYDFYWIAIFFERSIALLTLLQRAFRENGFSRKRIRRRFGLGGASFSESRILKVAVTDSEIILSLTDGRMIAAPLALYPTLLKSADRRKFRISVRGRGVHWPTLDFSLSLEGMLEGRGEYQRPRGTSATPTGNFTSPV